MHALVASAASYPALDPSFARLLASDRRRMARALVDEAPAAGGSNGPWRTSEVVLLAALGFFLASLLLNVAFA